jgi:hypothetical protein
VIHVSPKAAILEITGVDALSWNLLSIKVGDGEGENRNLVTNLGKELRVLGLRD